MSVCSVEKVLCPFNRRIHSNIYKISSFGAANKFSLPPSPSYGPTFVDQTDFSLASRSEGRRRQTHFPVADLNDVLFLRRRGRRRRFRFCWIGAGCRLRVDDGDQPARSLAEKPHAFGIIILRGNIDLRRNLGQNREKHILS